MISKNISIIFYAITLILIQGCAQNQIKDEFFFESQKVSENQFYTEISGSRHIRYDKKDEIYNYSQEALKKLDSLLRQYPQCRNNYIIEEKDFFDYQSKDCRKELLYDDTNVDEVNAGHVPFPSRCKFPIARVKINCSETLLDYQIVKKNVTSSYPTLPDMGTILMGDLDPDVVRENVEKILPEVKACFNKELAKELIPTTDVLVFNVEFQILKNGRVKITRVTHFGSTKKSLINCVVTNLKLIHFPSPHDGKPVEVIQPFRFFPKAP